MQSKMKHDLEILKIIKWKSIFSILSLHYPLFFYESKSGQDIFIKLKDIYYYDQPRQHIKKQSYNFANKGPSSQGYGFSSIMYGCDSWTIKKAEHWRIDAFHCGVGEDSWESHWMQRDPTSPS